MRESEEADLGHARADSTSAGHEASPPMMPPPPPGITPAAAAAAAGGGAGTFHAVFLAAALEGSAPSGCPGGSRRSAARPGSGGVAIAGGAMAAAGADCAGAAPPAAGDIGRRCDGGFEVGVLGGGARMNRLGGMGEARRQEEIPEETSEGRGGEGEGGGGPRVRREQCGGGRLGGEFAEVAGVFLRNCGENAEDRGG